MNKKIIGVIEAILGFAFITLLYFNIPGRFFIYSTIADSNSYNLIYLFNYSIYFIISLVFVIIFDKDKLHFKGFFTYIVIFAIVFVLNMLFIFIQDFNLMGYPLSFVGILFDGILMPIYMELVKLFLIFGLIILGLNRIMETDDFKGLMNIVFSVTLCIGVSFLFHSGDSKAYFYYMGYGFLEGIAVYYIYNKTHSLLTPISYFAISRMCILPNCFSKAFADTILPFTNYAGGVLFVIMGSILIGMIVYDVKNEKNDA